MREEELKTPNNKIIAAVLLIVISSIFGVYFYIDSKAKYVPKLNDGKRWRIGYYEGGNYKDYQIYLIALVKGLETLKWLPELDFPKFKENDNTKAVWDFLVEVNSEYIEFVKEAYWTSDWYEDKRSNNKLKAIVYLQQRKLDLIIAGGTWGGLDLANYSHSVPTLVISTSDPIEAGIIKSAEDSGFSHVHAVCDPGRYERQIRAFHNIVDFKKLGVVYEETEEGRIYAALSSVLKISLEKQFDVVSCIAMDQNIPEVEAMEGVLKCHEELATKSDAVYITAHRGVNPKWMPGVLEPLFKSKTPTFAQEGPDQVKRGVMLSIARVEVEDMGLFQAGVVAQSFHGKNLGDIEQVYEEEKRIVVNNETARRIEYPISEAVIKVADTVYESIEHEK